MMYNVHSMYNIVYNISNISINVIVDSLDGSPRGECNLVYSKGMFKYTHMGYHLITHIMHALFT